MTGRQKRLVQASFEQVKPITNDAARLFYSCLFDLDPGLAALFTGALEEQSHKLMQMIGVAVRGLDRLDKLAPTLLARWNQSKMWGMSWAGMPMPWSMTAASAHSSPPFCSALSRTVTSAPSGL